MATLIVGPFPGLRSSAVRHLVRPEEVSHLINTNPNSYYWDFRSFPEKVADWQASQISDGTTRYISDGVWDAWQSPSATLARRGGDCEDHTILLLSLLLHQGVPARFMAGTLWTGRAWSGHAWVEGQDERGHFLIEATSGELFRVRPEIYRAGQAIPVVRGRAAA